MKPVRGLMHQELFREVANSFLSQGGLWTWWKKTGYMTMSGHD